MTDDFRVKDVLSLCVDWSCLSPTRATVDQFVNALDGAKDPFADRRSAARKPMTIDVIAVPLDAEFQQCGDAFLSLTRNISHGGIAILCTEEVKSPYLLLRLETAKHRSLQSLVRVIRSRSFYQFTEVSGSFVLKEEEIRANAPAKKSKGTGRRAAKSKSPARSTKRPVVDRDQSPVA